MLWIVLGAGATVIPLAFNSHCFFFWQFDICLIFFLQEIYKKLKLEKS
jgi:hypothetical protein